MSKRLFIFKTFILTCIILIKAPNLTVAISQDKKDVDARIYQYTTAADSCMWQFDTNKSKIYLDSASLYIKNVGNPLLHGFYHQIWGNFYTFERNDPLAHENYYKAIKWYEKTKQYDRITPLYYQLAFTYYQKQDTAMLAKMNYQIKLISSKYENNIAVLDRLGIAALYYHGLYTKDKKNTACLDSVVSCEMQFVNHYESDSTLYDQRGDVAFNYMLLALCMTNSHKYQPDSIGRYLEKAKQRINPLDMAMMVNLCYINGEIALAKNNFTDAEYYFNRVLTVMKNWTENDNQSLYIDVYSRLSEISEQKQDYKAALEYEREKSAWENKIFDIDTSKIIADLNEKYEVKKKDTEIEHLHERTRLYLGIIALALLVFFFSVRWVLLRKKITDSQLQLEKIRKEKLEAEVRLKDERLKKAELEKYETLLDLYFKNRQISEADNTLMELKNEQKKLNGDLQKYAERLTQYEQMKFVSAIEDPYFNNIANDVYTLISKRVNDSNIKDIYYELLKELKNNFFMNLIKAFHGDLSVINIKYCIGFATGMSTKDIAECFSVELHTVHKVRHRLKSKLNLDKNEDIDFNLFLRQLNN